MMVTLLVVIALFADIAVVVVTAMVLFEARQDRRALLSSEANAAYMAAAKGEIAAAWLRLVQGIVLTGTSVLLLLYVVPLWPFQRAGLGPRLVTILALLTVAEVALMFSAVWQRRTRQSIIRHLSDRKVHE